MAFFFDRWGSGRGHARGPGPGPGGDAIEAGAQNVEPLEAEEVTAGCLGVRFLTDPKDLAPVSSWLAKLAGRSWPAKCATWPGIQSRLAEGLARKSPSF
jgi:hypothetical protein